MHLRICLPFCSPGSDPKHTHHLRSFLIELIYLIDAANLNLPINFDYELKKLTFGQRSLFAYRWCFGDHIDGGLNSPIEGIMDIHLLSVQVVDQ